MNATLITAVILNVASVMFALVCMLLAIRRAEQATEDAARLAKMIARAEAQAECAKLARMVRFRFQGQDYAISELRKTTETTAALVEEIASIDSEPADAGGKATPP